MRRFFLSTMASRRFAPLGKDAVNRSGAPELRGVVFDVDGTLCEPQNYMFGQMRAALGIDKAVDILEHIYNQPTPEERAAAMETIRAIEREAMKSQTAQPGLVELMAYLDARGLPKAICTRNFNQPVDHLLARFLSDTRFHPIITRDFRPPKPDPAGILHIARSWGLTRSAQAEDGDGGILGPGAGKEEDGKGEEGKDEALAADASGLIMVGDSIDDMTAGRRAGAATVLLVNGANRHLAEHEHTDLVISRLDDLVAVLEDGFEGRVREGRTVST